METSLQRGVEWRRLFAKSGFPYLFTAMFVSLFGTGLNFAGTTWYVLERTGSTVATALVTVLVTAPGLVVPPFGGVLIDRVDRRYLGIALDVLRGVIVLGTALLLALGRAEVWHIYGMVLLLGVGFSIYWSTTHALIQEVVGRSELVGANAAVLVAVQGGMMAAGACVGFVYNTLHLGGILTIDALTYFVSATCLLGLRRGYLAPHTHAEAPAPAAESAAPAEAPATGEEALLPFTEPEMDRTFVSDLREGLRYLRSQPRVLALGLTYALMMAGVLSGNVLIAALTMKVLAAGPAGFGYMEAGWALGAVAGGLLTGAITSRLAPGRVLIVALSVLAGGHAALPWVKFLALAVAAQAVFGMCRALGGVLTQSSIMTVVPRRLMGRTQSAFSVIATTLQMLMSLAIGGLAESNLRLAFVVLGLLYAAAAIVAARTRREQLRPAGGAIEESA
jgi:MFS family permease